MCIFVEQSIYTHTRAHTLEGSTRVCEYNIIRYRIELMYWKWLKHRLARSTWLRTVAKKKMLHMHIVDSCRSRCVLSRYEDHTVYIYIHLSNRDWIHRVIAIELNRFTIIALYKTVRNGISVLSFQPVAPVLLLKASRHL